MFSNIRQQAKQSHLTVDLAADMSTDNENKRKD